MRVKSFITCGICGWESEHEEYFILLTVSEGLVLYYWLPSKINPIDRSFYVCSKCLGFTEKGKRKPMTAQDGIKQLKTLLALVNEQAKRGIHYTVEGGEIKEIKTLPGDFIEKKLMGLWHEFLKDEKPKTMLFNEIRILIYKEGI